MGPSKIDQLTIAKIAGGQAFAIPAARFGPFFAAHARLEIAKAQTRLIDFTTIGSEHDDLIRKAFEGVRGGFSVDRFLCDPANSLMLQKECARLGLKAPEVAINLRLLAIRKHGSQSRLNSTERPISARDVVERLGLGVEAAMRFTTIRFGASVDDMLAHPEVGSEFARFARHISPGGSEIDYRTCALQIRKSRHISGPYEPVVDQLKMSMINKRWIDLGDISKGLSSPPKDQAGIIELRTDTDSLYILRTSHLISTLDQAFTRSAVARLWEDHIFDTAPTQPISLRYIGRNELPVATPKAWELYLVRELRPRFNWPISKAA